MIIENRNHNIEMTKLVFSFFEVIAKTITGESATIDLLSLANAGITKCVDQIYPHL